MLVYFEQDYNIHKPKILETYPWILCNVYLHGDNLTDSKNLIHSYLKKKKKDDSEKIGSDRANSLANNGVVPVLVNPSRIGHGTIDEGGAEIYKPPTTLARFRANKKALSPSTTKKTFPTGCDSCLTLISRGRKAGEGNGCQVDAQAVSTVRLLRRCNARASRLHTRCLLS